jgi:predicted RNA-binding protein YlxR (DUF448 family)
MRTCVGCQGRFPVDTDDLHVRVVLGLDADQTGADVAVDFAGSGFGRGAHVHLRPECIEKACRSGFSRAFKQSVRARPAAVAAEVIRGANQRIQGLLSGARRARLLAIGDEARDAMAQGKAELAVVALDAGASATKGALLSAVREGRVVAVGTKAELGGLFGQGEVAVIAVLHPGIAAEIQRARAASDAVGAMAQV